MAIRLNPYYYDCLFCLESLSHRSINIGQIQIRATNIPSSLKNKPYHELLQILNLPTLKSLKVVNRRCHYDVRKFSFCNRTINVWNSGNSLPEKTVLAPSQNSFQNKLDRPKHWHCQEFGYNWQAEITGQKKQTERK